MLKSRYHKLLDFAPFQGLVYLELNGSALIKPKFVHEIVQPHKIALKGRKK